MSVLAAERMSRQQVEPSGGTVTLRIPDFTTVTSATFEVKREAVTYETGTATITSVEGGYVLSASIGALEINDAYQVTFTPNTGPERRVLFDVVKQPYGPLINFDEIVSEKPDLKGTIEQFANLSGVTVDEYTEIIADSARCILDDMVRNRLQTLYSGNQWNNTVSRIFLRGYMPVDLNLRRIERYIAVSEAYSRNISGSAEEDESFINHKLFLDKAKAVLNASGVIRLDIDQDGKTDGTVNISNVITVGRTV